MPCLSLGLSGDRAWPCATRLAALRKTGQAGPGVRPALCYTGRMPHRFALHEMAARIRSRSISPVELVDAHLKQIERCNPKLNAFVRVLAGEAVGRSNVAEERQIRGGL